MTNTHQASPATTSVTDPDDYLFDTGSTLGEQHMDHLAAAFDEHSWTILEPIRPRPGQRCLDVGAGGGSVTRWLANRVGVTGEVAAVDLDTARLQEWPGTSIHEHDINDGLTGPLTGPYDLIHALLVLMHLPRRDEILEQLVDALAPGGWLVVGDASNRPLTVLSAPRASDIAVWERIQHLSHHVVSPAAGLDVTWSQRINARMIDAGLIDIHGIEASRTMVGGSPEALLHANLNSQAHDHLLAVGAEEWEMRRYQELTRDPAFRAWSYQFVCFRGRKSFD